MCSPHEKNSWRGNTEFSQYLTELSSFGVDKLNREPERLAEEKSQILEQTQDLAFHNYKTFIQTAECSKEIFQDVIEKHVNSMLNKLPKVNSECSNFLKQAQDINTSRRMNSMTLHRHTQLLEILEMPQLMDTCVRNGYYEEALELTAHVKRLEKKHSNLPVILKIVEEVKNSTQLMLNQLIHQLRSNIQLPACLRVIGYLRRMDVFTEAELRIKFLQARDAWFQGTLAGIPGDDPYYHITKTIEASRVHLFDIITQYRAIFSDEDPIGPVKDDSPNEAALFHGWVIQKVSQFLATLEMDLKKGIGGRLDSLLGQCMYFGLSFSRVGADFRGLLAPIFQRAALQGFLQSVAEANQRLDESMQSYTLLGTITSIPSSALNLAAQTGGSLHPPSVLLEFSPLAVYCNNILTAFNDLRLCAPLSLACDVADNVQASLTKASLCILAYHRAEEATFNPQEAEKFTSFCRVFAEELVPFLNKCLQVLFPPVSLAHMLGLHVSELSKLGCIGVMDIEAILESIEHLLPVKVEPPPEPEKDDVIGQSQDEEEESKEGNDQSTASKTDDADPAIVDQGNTERDVMTTADGDKPAAVEAEGEGEGEEEEHKETLEAGDSESDGLSTSDQVEPLQDGTQIEQTEEVSLNTEITDTSQAADKTDSADESGS